MENKISKPALPVSGGQSLWRRIAGRYFKYAIGEILLVVIGILLALQINNWNIESKARASEQYYLNQIVEDLKSDQISLVALKDRFDSRLPWIESLVDALYQELDVPKFKTVFQEYIDNVWQGIYFSSKSTTYEEMKSSGNLGLIRDRDLRNGIMEYYKEMDLLEAALKLNAEWLMLGDNDITHFKGLAKYLNVQSSIFSKYLTDSDMKEVLMLKTDLINNAATHHWVIKDLSPEIERQIEVTDQMIDEIEAIHD